MTPVAMAAFGNMTALSTSGSPRPFDVRRDGFVIAEGGAVLVLEELEHAKARGRPHLRRAARRRLERGRPPHHGTGTRRCRCDRLHRARSRRRRDHRAEVAHVNAHGTSTPLNDLAEAEAIEKVFGRPGPLVTSIKGVTGHSLGAAGAIEAVACALSIERRLIPPTVGLEQQDPEIHLDIVRDASPRVGTRADPVQQLRFRGPQWLHRARPRYPPEPRQRGVVGPGEFRRRARPRGRPDCAFAGFSDHPPWLVDPARPALARRDRRHPDEDAGRSPQPRPPARLPPAHRIVNVAWTLGQRGRGLVPRRSGRGQTRSRLGLVAASPDRFRQARAHLHQARPDPLLGRGNLPRGDRLAIPPAARPGAAGVIRRRAPHRRGRARRTARRDFRRVRPDADRRRLDRPGPRRPAAHGRAGGRQGAATRRRRARATRPRRA